MGAGLISSVNYEKSVTVRKTQFNRREVRKKKRRKKTKTGHEIPNRTLRWKGFGGTFKFWTSSWCFCFCWKFRTKWYNIYQSMTLGIPTRDLSHYNHCPTLSAQQNCWNPFRMTMKWTTDTAHSYIAPLIFIRIWQIYFILYTHHCKWWYSNLIVKIHPQISMYRKLIDWMHVSMNTN